MKRGIVLFCAISSCIAAEIKAQNDNIWTLEECISYAFEQNIQIRESELNNIVYGIYADQAKAQRFPSASASATQNFSWSRNAGAGETGFTGSSGSNYSLSSGVTIYNGSRLTNQIRQAELDIASGQYSIETTKESISLSILDAYLQVCHYRYQFIRESRLKPVLRWPK